MNVKILDDSQIQKLQGRVHLGAELEDDIFVLSLGGIENPNQSKAFLIGARDSSAMRFFGANASNKPEDWLYDIYSGWEWSMDSPISSVNPSKDGMAAEINHAHIHSDGKLIGLRTLMQTQLKVVRVLNAGEAKALLDGAIIFYTGF